MATEFRFRVRVCPRFFLNDRVHPSVSVLIFILKVHKSVIRNRENLFFQEFGVQVHMSVPEIRQSLRS